MHATRSHNLPYSAQSAEGIAYSIEGVLRKTKRGVRHIWTRNGESWQGKQHTHKFNAARFTSDVNTHFGNSED
ncbi:hypothetical protein NQZ68_020682 [Dissostichus eleginoides]|nr:hypothetical protein NQZ68_020682 [Dissostichus eleginoides]